MRRHKIFAVAGNPILHSKSPDLFNEAFRALSIEAVYTRIAATHAKEVIDLARDMGLAGLNITSPFKEDIMPYLDSVHKRARIIGAVNTIVKKRGQFIGYNTDIQGVSGALKYNNITTKGANAVVIGASGAAKAAVYALLLSGAKVTIINRTFEKAKEVAKILQCDAYPMEDAGVSIAKAQILVSCISTGERVIDPSHLKNGLVVFDAYYSKNTALQKAAKAKGCKIIDGREWLLFQALPVFTLFTGKNPPVGVMRDALYRKTSSRKKNIALIGFMGTGKSTIAEELSKNYNMTTIDIDRLIEKRSRITIDEIFKSQGEKSFRDMEHKELRRIKGLSNVVVACGGGIVTEKRNIAIIKKTYISIWLWSKVEVILDRIGKYTTRPLLEGKNKIEKMKTLLGFRLYQYALTSDILINTEGKSPKELARIIHDEVHTTLRN
ncbi:MAG TPA: shikimate dehydrogenase [Syntrophorhabdaceae bacterium]|nr:shikimate dehydrogenase [Syntrophorhabdaceae bacterium]